MNRIGYPTLVSFFLAWEIFNAMPKFVQALTDVQIALAANTAAVQRLGK